MNSILEFMGMHMKLTIGVISFILTEADNCTGLHKAIEYIGIDIQGHEHDATYDSIHTAALANKIKTGEVSKIHKDMQSKILKERLSISIGGLPLKQRSKLEALLHEHKKSEEDA